MSAPGHDRAFTLAPYSYAESRALADGLGVSDPVATTLVRRGYRSVEAAREFLEAAESHDPFRFEGMDEVVERLLGAARAGRAITVHGDFDVDGVCATTILVRALRDLEARCDWYIPDRMGDGYGLTRAGVERLAARGTELVVTVDCGITAADEVAAARAAGMDVIVTDHHAPDERLPDAPILHPVVCGYPCPDLCATGVAHKLAEAVREQGGGDGATAEAKRSTSQDLDLVALATVADLVPLTGENRSLVRRGLAEARRAQRPGLRALAAAAGVDPSRLDEGDLAFRLAPRINAAGRLYRADAGVELLLSRDPDRAEEIAAELDRANRERRDAERKVLAGAEAALREHPGGAQAPAIVVAGEGWHPGVIGIVASRLAERHWRPVVLIALAPSGAGRGSGRSIPAFDLVGALRECGEHLVRFGGHRAAAGLEIAPERVDTFREALVACASRLEPGDLTRTDALDVVVSGDRLGLDTAEELQRLGPFGIGNPGVRLLVPAARMSDVRPMGEGKHARFSVHSGAARALGVAFGSTDASLASFGDSPVDLSVGLEVNHWNGSVEPRVVLRDAYPIPANGRWPQAERSAACPSPAAGREWWRRFEAERDADLKPWPAAVQPGTETMEEVPRRVAVEHPGGSGVATLADLASSGAAVVALCADASRRGALAELADPRRFGGGAPEHLCGRCGAESAGARERLLGNAGPGLLLADWAALERAPEMVAGFEHVVLVDPPPFAHLEEAAVRGPGYVHIAWGEAELKFALQVHEAEWDPRGSLRDLYRALREHAGEPRDRELEAVLAGPGPHPRSPELAGRCVRILRELELVEGGDRSLRVVSSKSKQLDESRTYLAYRARCEEGKRFLGSRQRPRERARARARARAA